MLSRQRKPNIAAGQDAIPADGGIAFTCLCVFIKNALPCPPTAADKGVALDIVFFENNLLFLRFPEGNALNRDRMLPRR